jgi:glycosyltransferase involved in cell wall biosynthesis
MKILIITNHYLDGGGGGTVGSRGFINAFASIYPNCLLIYPDNGHDISKIIRPGLKSIGCSDNRPRWLKGIGIYFGKLHRFGSLAKRIISDYKPEVVVFDTSTVASGLIRYVKNEGIRIITIHHNVEKDYFRDNPPPIHIRLPYLFYIERTEKDAVNLSDLNLTHTESDTQKLLEYYSSEKTLKIKCIGVLGTESGRSVHKEMKKKSDESGKILFVMSGRLSYLQSDSSFIAFIEKYMPVLTEMCKNMELIIAGSDPSGRLVEACGANENIRLIQNPPDMMEIVAEADVYICPVDKGSGLKIRIMDGLKAGIPVVAHEVSARGYEHFIETGAIHVYSSVSTFRASLKLILGAEINRKERIEQYRYYFSEENGIARLKSLIDLNLTE